MNTNAVYSGFYDAKCDYAVNSLAGLRLQGFPPRLSDLSRLALLGCQRHPGFTMTQDAQEVSPHFYFFFPLLKCVLY